MKVLFIFGESIHSPLVVSCHPREKSFLPHEQRRRKRILLRLFVREALECMHAYRISQTQEGPEFL